MKGTPMARAEHSSLDELAALKKAFVARQMSTAIKVAEKVSLTEDPKKALARLTALAYDQAPVHNGKKLVGWVKTQSLAGSSEVSESLISLADSRFVSADSSLESVLALLPEQEFLFTVDESGIQGFICISDLDRHIVRAYFGIHLSQVEMMLTQLARAYSTVSEVEDHISKTTKHSDGRSLWKEYKTASEKGLATHPAEYLYLEQLITLLRLASDRQAISVPKSMWKWMQVIKDNRNFLAHSARNLSAGQGAKKMAELQVAFTKVINFLNGNL